MKSLRRFSLPLALCVGLAGCPNSAAPSATTSASVAPVETKAAPAQIGVDALMKDVEHHHGLVVVEGVVKSASAESKMLELIDCEEFRSCGTTHCAKLILPVRCSGALPAERDTVRATGEVREEGGKFVFVASAIEVEPKEPTK